MSGLALTVAAAAGKDLFKKAILDLYEFCKGEIGEAIKEWLNPRKFDSLFKRIALVKKVKTIWQVDKAVDLEKFYCDSHVLLGKRRKKISRISDFETTDNILIQGIAGQGKSILLRYLCANELQSGVYIPIFVELNRVGKDSDLMGRIITSFLGLGLSIDEKTFRTLAKSGKVLLLLDAFDEVPNESKTKVLTDIEDLAAAYENLRIVVTSRPNNNIQVSRHFSVVTLDDLKGDEFSNVIKKLATGPIAATLLIDHIETKAPHVKGLLCTPLMVTLLVISYKSFQQLPTKLSDFYDSLFQTLLQRHDGTKPGFTRTRGCLLDDSEYRSAFEGICILGKKFGTPSFSTKSIQALAKDALSKCGFRANPVEFVDDIVKITCLIIRDGEEHRFIHKTVQEYYTASYIQKKPEPWVKEFYSRILEKGQNSGWTQELEFLSEIDSYRHNRFYYIPWVKKLLQLSDEDLLGAWKPIPINVVASFFSGFLIFGNSEKQEMRFLSHRNVSEIAFPFFISSFKRAKTLNSEIAEAFSKCRLSDEEAKSTLEKTGRVYQEVSSKDFHAFFLDRGILKDCLPSLVLSVQGECKKLFEKAQEIQAELMREESPSILDELV